MNQLLSYLQWYNRSFNFWFGKFESKSSLLAYNIYEYNQINSKFKYQLQDYEWNAI